MAANRKQPYNWHLVKPGDIISFRYKSKSTNETHVHSVLVLNPRLPVTLKDGTKTQHLVGIKLEESNKVSLRLTMSKIAILEDLGEFEKIDEVKHGPLSYKTKKIAKLQKQKKKRKKRHNEKSI